MYPNASYNCAGCLGRDSPLFKKTTPKFVLVYLPTISELRKFPNLTKQAPIAMGTVTLSSNHRSGL